MPELPTELHEPGIVTSGAIIVFDGNNRRAASYISGTLWVGSLELPDTYSLDVLDNTSLRPRAALTADDVIQAAQRFTLWQTIARGPDTKARILTALDALHVYEGVQQLLAFVCGLARERLLRQLVELVKTGFVIRSGSVRTANRYELPAKLRGKYWNSSLDPKLSPYRTDTVALKPLLQTRATEQLQRNAQDVALLAALREFKLNTYQFAVYEYLVQHADQHGVTKAPALTIAAATRLHVQTVSAALTKLARVGLITAMHKPGSPSRYSIPIQTRIPIINKTPSSSTSSSSTPSSKTDMPFLGIPASINHQPNPQASLFLEQPSPRKD
jgi:hypothetical protein